MFYFDETLKTFEKGYAWDKALIYLEELFIKQHTISILNSLIGFSWYYMIEGPIDSLQYEKDENTLALDVWKKYLKVGMDEFGSDFSFCFIAGYTILLHGFLIKECKTNNELIGIDLLKRATKTENLYLKELSEYIIHMQQQKKYKPLIVNREIVEKLFTNDSLLENYFKEIYR